MRPGLFLVLIAGLGLLAPVTNIDAQSSATDATCYVLDLDGTNSFVRLPPQLLDGLKEATLEGWVKWRRFDNWPRFFSFGKGENRVGIMAGNSTNRLDLSVDERVTGTWVGQSIVADNALSADGWIHVAAVFSTNGTTLFVNGRKTGANPRVRLATVKENTENRLGICQDISGPLDGQMAEVRLWRVARSPEEILARMHDRLSGGESNLVALWNFKDPANPGRDLSPAGNHGKLIGGAKLVATQSEPGTLGGVAPPLPVEAPGKDPVLSVEGGDGSVELPPNLLTGHDEVTIEVWAKWNQFRPWSMVFMFSEGENSLKVYNRESTRKPSFVVEERLKPDYQGQGADGTEDLALGEWTHVAAVFTPEGMKLYADGELIAANPGGQRAMLKRDLENRLANWGFVGELGEARIWNVARTPEQIATNRFLKLTGREPDLLALWNFAQVTNGVVPDLSPGAHHARLVGAAHIKQVRGPQLDDESAVVSGKITEPGGIPAVGVEVTLFANGVKWERTRTKPSGKYSLRLPVASAPLSISASRNGAIAVASLPALKASEQREVNLTLLPPGNVLGKVSDAVGKPLAGVQLQIFQAEVKSQSSKAGDLVSDLHSLPLGIALTHGDGTYHFRHVTAGEYLVRAQSPTGWVWFAEGKPLAMTIGVDRPGVDFQFPARPPLGAQPAALNPLLSLTNHVLSLEVRRGYVELPTNIFNELDEATIEGWMRWSSLATVAHSYDYGHKQGDLAIKAFGASEGVVGKPNDLEAFQVTNQDWHVLHVADVLQTNAWTHVALVTGKGGRRLYLNGTLVSADRFTGSFSALENGEHHFLGRSSWDSNSAPSMEGQMDEIRVWVTARTGEEIRDNMIRRLTGAEEGLAALWNFDDPAQPARDASPHLFHGVFRDQARVVEADLPAMKDLVVPASLRGTVTDTDGRALVNVKVLVTREAGTNQTLTTDSAGGFLLMTPHPGPTVTLEASRGEFKCLPTNVVMRGEQSIQLILRDLSSVSGKVLALDDSPLPAVVVQAVPITEATEEIRPDKPGLWGEYYQLGYAPKTMPLILPDARPTSVRVEPVINFPGAAGGASLGRGERNGEFYAHWTGKLRIERALRAQITLEAEDGGRMIVDGKLLLDADAWHREKPNTASLELSPGDHPVVIDYINEGGTHRCQLYWSVDGGPREIIPASAWFHNDAPLTIATTMSDARGVYHFPTLPPGRYQLRAHVPGGMALRDEGREIIVVENGSLGNLDFQLAPFKKGRWQNFSHVQGLAEDYVNSSYQAADGAMWFGTQGGVSRFDGDRNFRTLTVEDGLPRGQVRAITGETNGVMWFGTSEGLCRYDSRGDRVPAATATSRSSLKGPTAACMTFTTTNGLAGNDIRSLVWDQLGRLWVGTDSGLSILDGTNLVSSTGTIANSVAGGVSGKLMGEAQLITTEGPDETSPPALQDQVVQFEGPGSYVNVPGFGAYAPTNEITVEFWQLATATVAQSTFMTWPDVVTNRMGAHVPWSDGSVAWFFGDAPQGGRLDGAMPSSVAGSWQHFALVASRSGNYMRIYRDGVLEASKSDMRPFVRGKCDLRIGGFAGRLTDFRIWATARTETEIREKRFQRLTGKEPGLVGLWNFAVVTNGLVQDLGVGAHAGILTGNATVIAASRPAATAGAMVQVLQLDGNGSFATLGDRGVMLGTHFTEEAWIRPTRNSTAASQGILGGDASPGPGNQGQSRAPSLFVRDGTKLQFGFGDGTKLLADTTPTNVLVRGKWNHVATTYDGKIYQCYVNGELVHSFSTTAVPVSAVLWIGRLGGFFSGQVRDVRLWNTTRTAEQIRTNRFNKLTGREAGLAGLWRFDEPEDTSPGGQERRTLEPLANRWISTLYRDSSGAIWIGTTDEVWRFTTAARATNGPNLKPFRTPEGLALWSVVSIFQAKDETMWFGTIDLGVSHYDPAPPAGIKAFTRFTRREGLPDNCVWAIAQDHSGAMWFAAGPPSSAGDPPPTGLSRYDGKSFVNYTVVDGLASHRAQTLHLDGAGDLWVGTMIGVSRFDFESIAAYGGGDGMDPGAIDSIASTSDGNVWFVARPGRLSRHDGNGLVKVTQADGLSGGLTTTLLVDTNGSLLVGDGEAGVARSVPGGVPGGHPRFALLENTPPVSALGRSANGDLWYGTDKGAYRLGMPPTSDQNLGGVSLVRPGSRGVMWFVLQAGGVACFDGTNFTRFTSENGLPVNDVRGLQPLPDGTVLAATMRGAARFDGEKFVAWPTNFARLTALRCYDVRRDREGLIWLGTPEGAFLTDGTAWSNLDERDGLPDNLVNRIHPVGDGSVWIGTWQKGLARYRRSSRTPRSPTIIIQADREYTDPAALPIITTGQRVTFKFKVVEFRTAPEKRQFRWQLLKGVHPDGEMKGGWEPPSTATQIEHSFQEPGPWTLAVQFIDRDLNYSPPTCVTLNVAVPWQANARIMVPVLFAMLGLLVWAIVARMLYSRKRREAERLREQLFEEEHHARQEAERAQKEIETKAAALAESNRQLDFAREAAEQARFSADQANQAKSIFLANMSHELRTPLNAIIGYSEMLEEEVEDIGQPGLKPDLEKIRGAGKHLLGLINDVLDLSKVEAGKMTMYLEEFEVAKIVGEVAATVQPLVAKNGNQLVVDCTADIGMMRADVTKLRQTLFNLLSNASKFTERGVIRFAVAKGESNQLTVIRDQSAVFPNPTSDPRPPTSGRLSIDPSSLITFRVTDSGIGMTPEQIGRLFEAFSQADASTTRKYGGTGLGLAISRKFCEMMGGQLSVESQPGKGSTFTVTLPVVVKDPAAEAGAEVMHQPSQSDRLLPSAGTVLVIDDNAQARDLIQRSLAREGYQVLLASDGKIGLELAKQIKPDVITLDVMMQGMDGWAVLAALKAQPATADIPVIMVTIVDDQHLGIALGAADYFTKPIDWERLSGVLRKYRKSEAPQTVLVIEDDAATREMLRRTLEKEGWRVAEAENGRVGLEKLSAAIPALILLDLMMPEVDGFEFMEALRQNARPLRIPVIVITAKELTEEDRRRLNGGVECIIRKSATAQEQMLAEVRSVLRLSK